MIPESRMVEILQEGLEVVLPGQVNDSGIAQRLARYITRRSYDVMKDEKAPKSALLQAACIVITASLKAGNSLNAYEVESLGQVVASLTRPSGEGAGVGHGAPDLANALIQLAESTGD